MLVLFTNGTLINEATADRLAVVPPNRIDITLYGATAATYEAVTGVSGSYARCCAGIETLLKHRVPLGLKTTITRQNVGELEAMRQMAHNWGLPLPGAWLVSRRPDGTLSDADGCRLSALECVALEATDGVSADEWTEATLRGSAAASDLSFQCRAGVTAFAVNPSGEMNACLSLPRPAARPLETGFAAAWEEVRRYVDSAPAISSVCLSCDACVYCRRCPAWSFMETGTLTDPVPYLCQIARARKDRYVHTA
jgi:radical SAM protein with 4Fe4S-binding SPASM domain